MRERVRDVVAEVVERPPVDPDERAEAATCSSGWTTATSPSSATASTTSSAEDGEDVLRAVSGSGLGILRADRRAADLGQLRAAAARGAPARAREEPAQPDEGELAGDRAPARVPRLRRGQALRRRRRGRPASGASSGSTRTPRTARARGRSPCSGARRSAWSSASGLLHGQPRPQGARRDPRDVSARRAVPDLGGRALRDRARHPPPRRAPRACGCSSAGTRSAASSRASSTCRASASTPRTGSGSRTSSSRRSAARASTTRRASPSRCSRASTSSCYTEQGAIREYDVAEIEARLAEATRAWTDDLARRARRSSSARSVPARSSSATATRSPAPTARTSPPARRCRTSSGSSGSTRTATSA